MNVYMPIRVTQNMLNNSLLYNLHSIMARLNKYQDQLASGKEVRFPSDDVVAATRISTLSTNLKEIKQYGNNISEARAFINQTDSSLQELLSIMRRVKELTIRGANGTLTQEDREAIAVEMRELRKHVVQIAASDVGGRHIFSGAKDGITPFKDDGTLNTPESSDDVNYFDQHLKVQLGSGVYRQYTLNVKDVFLRGVTYRGQTALNNISKPLNDLLSLSTTSGTIAFTDKTTSKSFNITYNLYDPPPSGEKPDINLKTDGLTKLVNTINANSNNDFIHASIDEDGRLVLERKVSNSIPGTNPDGMTPVDLGKSVDISDSGDLLKSDGLGILDGANNVLDQVAETGTNILGVFSDIINHLEHANVKGGVDNLTGEEYLGEADLANLTEITANIRKQLAIVGTIDRSLELFEDRRQSVEFAFTDLLSKRQDVDISKKVLELKEEQNVYQAALSVGAKVIMPTLVDFLR